MYLLLDQRICTIPDNTTPKDTRRKWLLDLYQSFVAKYVFESTRFVGFAEQTTELQQVAGGPFNCREQNCERVSAYHSGRVK
jgi:hypothetical protein